MSQCPQIDGIVENSPKQKREFRNTDCFDPGRIFGSTFWGLKRIQILGLKRKRNGICGQTLSVIHIFGIAGLIRISSQWFVYVFHIIEQKIHYRQINTLKFGIGLKCIV